MESEDKFNLYPDINHCTVAVIGLGYVGLPLAIELSKERVTEKSNQKIERKIIGYDINKKRIRELSDGIDRTNEINMREFSENMNLKFTTSSYSIIDADVFIVTVPTPIDINKKPDLRALKSASETVGKALKLKKENSKNSKINKIPIVIYESTVYPGTTEEICIPIIEKYAGLTCDSLDPSTSFACGYSPERINPGDKINNLINIKKVTSGSDLIAADWIDQFYSSIIKAGTHKAQSIKVAEAAKIIENTQRDINIALVNELAVIFKLMKVDTFDVLEAASTKWNFLPFKPGLVGGHCIGVDPYYLTYKSEMLGYSPKVVLSGRKVNDEMPKWIVDQLILEMCKRKINLNSANILILGFTFKENCPDVRNTKVFDIFQFLLGFGLKVDIVDPWVDKDAAREEYGINVLDKVKILTKYSVVISAVSHRQFLNMSVSEWTDLIKANGILFDIKGVIPRELKPLRI